MTQALSSLSELSPYLLLIIMVFISPVWSYYALVLVSFWWLWANVMSTATSLRFENP